MVDAATVAAAYAIGVTGFWRISGQHYSFSTTGRIAFAAFWPVSFACLLLGVV